MNFILYNDGNSLLEYAEDLFENIHMNYSSNKGRHTHECLLLFLLLAPNQI